MKKRLLATLAVLALAAAAVLALSATASAAGATQISGVAYPADPTDIAGPCYEPSAAYAIEMRDGDLEGCIYGFNPDFTGPGPSGVVKERADELFVGSWGDLEGTFGLKENFHAKIDQYGFCKHPIVKGSGTGDFEGVTGRLDFRDDLDAGTFPYKGHLKLA